MNSQSDRSINSLTEPDCKVSEAGRELIIYAAEYCRQHNLVTNYYNDILTDEEEFPEKYENPDVGISARFSSSK